MSSIMIELILSLPLCVNAFIAKCLWQPKCCSFFSHWFECFGSAPRWNEMDFCDVIIMTILCKWQGRNARKYFTCLENLSETCQGNIENQTDGVAIKKSRKMKMHSTLKLHYSILQSFLLLMRCTSNTRMAEMHTTCYYINVSFYLNAICFE